MRPIFMITLKICLPNWSSLSNTNVHFCRYTKYERTRCYLNDYGISTKMSARKIRRTNRVGVESRSRLWCNIHGYKCEAFPLHVKVVGSSKTIIEMMGSIRNGVTRKIQKCDSFPHYLDRIIYIFWNFVFTHARENNDFDFKHEK